MKKYDENQVIRSLSKNYNAILEYRFGNPTLVIPIEANVGIHSLGMIDYLRKYTHTYVVFEEKQYTPKVKLTKREKEQENNKYVKRNTKKNQW